MRLVAAVIVLAFAFQPVTAQEDARAVELGAIRAEVDALNREIVALRDGLMHGQRPQGVVDNGPILDRIDDLEAQLQRVTGALEESEFRVRRIVEDGTNRLRQLEFRIVQLEGGDVMSIGQVPPLGGSTDPAPAAPVADAPRPAEAPVAAVPDGLRPAVRGPVQGGEAASVETPVAPPALAPAPVTAPVAEELPPEEPEVELAVAEREGFEGGMIAFEAGEYAKAAELFTSSAKDFPGGPLEARARYWEGESRYRLEDWKASARAFLSSFTAAPDGPEGDDSLFGLGRSLARLEQTKEACLALEQLALRYTNSDLLGAAATESAAIGCE